MNFKKMLTLLTEKNIYYKVPSDDIQRLYDFYYLTTLQNHLMSKGSSHRGPHGAQISGDNKWFGLRDESLQESLNDAATIITNDLYKQFHRALPNHIISEIDSMRGVSEEADEMIRKKFDIDDDTHTYDIDDLPISDGKKIRLISYILKDTPIDFWKRWKKVADAWIRLDTANTHDDKVIAIDHIFDLEHGGYNNPDVYSPFLSRIEFDKNKTNTGSTRLVKALDHKANTKSVWDLEPYVSPLARSIGTRISKALGLGTKESNPIKKVDDRGYKYALGKPGLTKPTPEHFIEWVVKTFGKRLAYHDKPWGNIDDMVGIRNDKNNDDEEGYTFFRYKNGAIHMIDRYTSNRPLIKSVKAPKIITAEWLIKAFDMEI